MRPPWKEIEYARNSEDRFAMCRNRGRYTQATRIDFDKRIKKKKIAETVHGHTFSMRNAHSRSNAHASYGMTLLSYKRYLLLCPLAINMHNLHETLFVAENLTQKFIIRYFDHRKNAYR